LDRRGDLREQVAPFVVDTGRAAMMPRVLTEPGSRLVIGHRGAASAMPENTVPSFSHAVSLGVDAIEFDVRVTADGVPIVHHDPETSRTCGDSLVIAESPWSALRTLNAGATFRGAGNVPIATTIPLLDDVLSLTHDIPVIIECKTAPAAAVVVDALRRHAAQSRAVVGSFLHPAMQVVRAASVASGASRRDMLTLYARSLLGAAPHRLPFAAMCVPEQFGALRVPLARFAAWGRACGVPVHVWTVNAAADATRLWDAGVTGILTDDPATILAARSAMSSR
jgi:glycerophosphoryl diester phosphodiesterase